MTYSTNFAVSEVSGESLSSAVGSGTALVSGGELAAKVATTMRMTHERMVEGARRYHVANNAVVKIRSYADAGEMLKMQTPESVRARVAQIIEQEIMPRLALMKKRVA